MKIVLSNAATAPLYAQIVRQVKATIVSGDLAAGASLPSIRKLARDLGISVITTKRAYDELEGEGLVDVVPGKGAFVAAQSLDRLHERRRSLVEEKLAEAVAAARAHGIEAEDLHVLLRLLWENEG